MILPAVGEKASSTFVCVKALLIPHPSENLGPRPLDVPGDDSIAGYGGCDGHLRHVFVEW